LFIPEARDQVGNLFWAVGHHSALGWSPFGIEDLSPDGQVARAYKLLSPMLPQLAEWQAAGKVNGILITDGEKSEPVSLGGYKISLSVGMAFGAQAPKPDSEAELGAGVTSASRAMPSDKRPFAIVVNTAPDEFLFIGANGDPVFTSDSGLGRVVISSRDEGLYENGKWIASRRLNGDELFQSGLPKTKVGMLKVKLVRIP
jgi:hypothetical protein